jgi:hypothetical protein
MLPVTQECLERLPPARIKVLGLVDDDGIVACPACPGGLRQDGRKLVRVKVGVAVGLWDGNAEIVGQAQAEIVEVIHVTTVALVEG